MRYRVRNEHGELTFESFEALKEAFRQSLVDPDDDVMEEGAATWRKASTVPKLMESREAKPPLMQTEARWYVIAIVVFAVGAGVLITLKKNNYVGLLIALVIAMFSTSFFVWSQTRRKRR